MDSKKLKLKKEFSKYWKNKLKKVFWEYVDITLANKCIARDHVYIQKSVEHRCSGQIERHHLISRGRKEFTYNINNIVKLCEFHHKGSNLFSAHRTQKRFSQWLSVQYPKKYEWYMRNKNRIVKKYERQSYKELYYEYLNLINEKRLQ